MKRATCCALGALLLLGSCDGREASFAATGAFEATEIILSAEATGRIVELEIEEGQTVQAGQVVGRLDCQQLTLQREQLLASIGAMSTRRANIDLQLAAVEQQVTTLKDEKKRIEALTAAGAVPRKQLDDLDAQLLLLEKQMAASRFTMQSNNRGISEESTGVQLHVAQLDDQLMKCTIVCPMGGAVLVKYAERGELATIGKALFKIADTENLFLRAYITADQLAAFKLGQQLPVEADSGASENRKYSGTLAWISSKSEFTPRTIQTKNERANLVYAIKVAVKNDGYLKLGMYGFIPTQGP